jgi:hypothetical protein
MFDKLQFVDASKESGTAENDKLKFIGHKAPSSLRSAGRTPKPGSPGTGIPNGGGNNEILSRYRKSE